MVEVYRKWIDEFVPVNCKGKCREACEAMTAVFPELRMVRGHYYCYFTEENYSHWWLMNGSGLIIDPTASQFISNGQGYYQEYKDPEPTGKCINCGGLLYKHGQYCCSLACAHALAVPCAKLIGGSQCIKT